MCQGVTVRGGVRREGAGESSLPLRGEGQGKRCIASIQKTPKLYKSCHSKQCKCPEPFSPPASLKGLERQRDKGSRRQTKRGLAI